MYFRVCFYLILYELQGRGSVVQKSTYGARRAVYVCGPLLARVAISSMGPRRFELRIPAV
jgi:hypothetical protein